MRLANKKQRYIGDFLAFSRFPLSGDKTAVNALEKFTRCFSSCIRESVQRLPVSSLPSFNQLQDEPAPCEAPCDDKIGFFVGKLGRQRTFALVEKGVTLPSDIHGVVYIPLSNGEWRLRLVKELKAAGLEVDTNRAF